MLAARSCLRPGHCFRPDLAAAISAGRRGELPDLVSEAGNLGVPLGEQPGYRAQRVAGSLLLIAEQAGGEPQHDDVEGRPEPHRTGRQVPREQPDLTAVPHGDSYYAAEDRGSSEEQHEGHTQNRAMPRPVLTPAPGNSPQPGPALIAVAASLGAATAAVLAGADIVDLGDPPGLDIAAFLTANPGVPFCAAGDDRAVLTRQAAEARIGGPRLICRDLAAAQARGLPPDQLVVQAPPAGIDAVTRAGYAALVDADQAGQTGCVAVAALSSWLGAALIRTSHPLQARRAIDMTAIIAGIRPPARTVRGLA